MESFSDNSQLTDAQKNQVSEWLDSKWSQNQNCEVCGHTAWSISQIIVSPLTHTTSGTVVGGTTYPQIMLICVTCGNTKYFNAVVMGLVASTSTKEV